MHERRIRRLTPNECERLQGLPDDYTKLGRYGDQIKEVSDTQRYKCLGNAFTVNVIEAIVLRMVEVGCLETK
jgi:DNA (cytosine-5)-methyltransferase 1